MAKGPQSRNSPHRSGSSSPGPQNVTKKRRGASDHSKNASLLSRVIPKIISVLVVPALLGGFGYQVHQRFIVLPNLVKTPSELPKVLPENNFRVETNPDRFWGTYRTNLYFGMRTRSPKSPLIGLMWYEQVQNVENPEQIPVPRIRHWCDQADGLRSYGWLEHDGKSFGIQEIKDEKLNIYTSFVKRQSGIHGGDWTAKVTADPNVNWHWAKNLANIVVVHFPICCSEAYPDVDQQSMNSFIVYIALPEDNDGSYIKPHITGTQHIQHIDHITGFTPELGNFKLRIQTGRNTIAQGFLSGRVEPMDLTTLNGAIIGGTGVIKLTKNPKFKHYLSLMGHVPPGAPASDRPNLLAMQVTYLTGTDVEIIYESVGTGNKPISDKTPLQGEDFDKLLSERSKEFNEKFEKLFGLGEKKYSDVYVKMGKLALSNMLGGIGYFHGYSKVISEWNKKPVPYGHLTLFTAVPSRPFFPRGFLWDEGFHHLLISRWDPELSLEILGSWLDLMNVEGWIPREMILGQEAESKVPSEYIVQHNSVANPPMFFYLLGKYLKANKGKFAEEHQDFFKKVYPRLKLWYEWLNSSQSGKQRGTFRWRGRNGTTDLELNPKTLPSGLDDYPRASHPTDDEYHVDLYCWMAVSSQVMKDLSEFVGDSAENQGKFRETAEFLGSNKLLDELHWSDKTERYCDYGLHTKNVKLEKPKPIMGQDGRPRPPPRPEMTRIVSGTPTLRLISDTFGYVSLFPMFLRIIPADSPKLGKILKKLEDPDLLWSKFGLRSLAKSSPLHEAKNTEHDPPYWRGSVWLNMNYLALSSLHHYSEIKGPFRDLAYEIYGKLRGTVITNVVREYQRTGYLWEHYNEETGYGEGCHPFTGWTSLVLLMMAEDFE